MNRHFITFLLAISLCLIPISSAIGATAQYTYDNSNRLVQVQYDDGTVIQYSYDRAGNRLTKQVMFPTQSSPAPADLFTPVSPSSPSTGTNSGLPADTPVISDSTTSGSVKTGATAVTQEAPAYLNRITGAGSYVEAAQAEQQFFDFLDRSDLTPADKERYKKQAAQALETRTASLKEETANRATGTVEKPPASPPQETKKPSQPDSGHNKIKEEGGKIYTVTPEAGEPDSTKK